MVNETESRFAHFLQKELTMLHNAEHLSLSIPVVAFTTINMHLACYYIPYGSSSLCELDNAIFFSITRYHYWRYIEIVRSNSLCKRGNETRWNVDICGRNCNSCGTLGMFIVHLHRLDDNRIMNFIFVIANNFIIKMVTYKL